MTAQRGDFRRRADAPAPYTFMGFPVPEELAHRIADRLVLRDERDGALIVRMRTELMRTTRKANQ